MRFSVKRRDSRAVKPTTVHTVPHGTDFRLGRETEPQEQAVAWVLEFPVSRNGDFAHVAYLSDTARSHSFLDFKA